MYHDLAPRVDERVLQRVARQQGYVGPNRLDSLQQQQQQQREEQTERWEEEVNKSNDLPLHLASTPEDVLRAYPPPPANFTGEKDTAKRSSLVQEEEIGKASHKRPRSVNETHSPNTTTTAATITTTTDQSQGNLSSSFTPYMHFAPSFERTDYLGRSFLTPPPSMRPLEQECRPPRQLKGSWGKHTAGIQQLQWVPPMGHLLFAADLKGEVRLHDAMASRKCIATFVAHTQPVKSLEVTPDATTMSTGSVDGTVAMWDVERGVCRGVLTNTEGLSCVQHLHHPFDPASLILAALDRKVVLYDVRVSQQRYQREYTGHMGTIFNLTLLSGGKKLLTTAEDKTLRTWDFRVPVQIKQIADVSMHAITHVVRHPTEDMLVAQSLNNQALVFADSGGGQVRLLRNRVFSGHTISGTRCQLAFSPDGRYLSSGDIHGKLFIWSWATAELVRSFAAHTQMLASHRWHPVEPSRVVTSAWDGTIKNWS
ncbi:uncharacterized protein TM35_000111640 [Trypanosoma theileri]|uniref:Uncharacterized protein n=1 Tax=Trypanosoma theileri TaxID=67003 RepID=A0A1X0NZP7_9TRYP|nr:uncharacterized protein TM35_000111640 [Trypanosoma theileri]ORC89630.1 hypothetical protein TM35_000111640 [Trypanosoma theileri]